jgi:hypothetical protein
MLRRVRTNFASLADNSVLDITLGGDCICMRVEPTMAESLGVNIITIPSRSLQIGKLPTKTNQCLLALINDLLQGLT